MSPEGLHSGTLNPNMELFLRDPQNVGFALLPYMIVAVLVLNYYYGTYFIIFMV